MSVHISQWQGERQREKKKSRLVQLLWHEARCGAIARELEIRNFTAYTNYDSNTTPIATMHTLCTHRHTRAHENSLWLLSADNIRPAKTKEKNPHKHHSIPLNSSVIDFKIINENYTGNWNCGANTQIHKWANYMCSALCSVHTALVITDFKKSKGK